MQEVCKKLIIQGKVQGVSYRAWTEENAKKLNLTGYVKNLPTGEVEAVFCGKQEIVDKMIKLCWSGPVLANINNISIIEVRDSFINFSRKN